MLEVIENRFGVQVALALGSEELTQEQAELVALHPHLWPFLLHGGQRFVAPLGVVKQPHVSVRVNWGVWQTPCPFCHSAQHASKNDQFFFCARCSNAAVNNRSIPVVWPGDAEAIEEELGRRPFRTTQNWEPHETLAELKAETDSHLTGES